MRASLVAALVLTAATATACHREAPRAATRMSAQDARRALIDRNWIDRMPEHKDDRLRLYRFTPAMGGGVYQDRKVFRGQFELFQYQVGDGVIAFHFPDTDEDVRSPFLIERVRGHEPFDLKLTVADDPRGPGVYWGASGPRGQALEPTLPTAR